MKRVYPLLILILLVIIGYLVYDKMTTKPTVVFQEPTQKQNQVSTKSTTTSPTSPPQKNAVPHDCLISAENFFEAKRASSIDLYSADWDAYYDGSSRICFVQINNGTIYNVTNGDTYRLEGSAFIETGN
jgi:hypothetical protein